MSCSGEEDDGVLEFLRGLGENVGAWLYLIAGGLAFAEAAVMVGVVLPGETALLVAGFAAHEGVIDLWPMVGIAVLAAIVGDTVGYEVGRLAGPRLRASRLGMMIGDERWSVGERFLRRHGGKAVLFGRSVALLRALTPGLAGMARMPYLRTFLPWNVTGGALWGAGCVLLGYAFALSLHTVANFLSWGPMAVVGVLAVLLGARELRRRRRRRAGTLPGRDADRETVTG